MGGSQEKQNTIDLHLQEPQMLELLGTKLLCIKCLKKMESEKDQETENQKDLKMIHVKILERKNIKTKNDKWIKQIRYTVKKKKADRSKEITQN